MLKNENIEVCVRFFDFFLTLTRFFLNKVGTCAELLLIYFNFYLMLDDLNFLFQILVHEDCTCRYQASFMHNTRRAMKI